MNEDRWDVTIVGAGFSGIAVAIALKLRGDRDFVILEKASTLGGTWRENTYPGCACDVQSHLYSYSFAPNPFWSRTYSGQEEILAYLRGCVDKYDLWPHIRFGVEMSGAHFDQHEAMWRLDTSRGRMSASNLVMAKGPLHKPRWPDIPGIDDFAGTQFHSAQWDHGHDLTDKNVAVVGTGASAVQLIPQIAPKVRQLRVIQRTPAWVLPRPDRRIPGLEQRLFEKVPLAHRLHRHFLYWHNETRALLMHHPSVARAFTGLGRSQLRRTVVDPRLREALTPHFALGCKRVPLSNDFYPTFARDNVTLVPHALTRLDPDGAITANGERHAVDTVIHATGFNVTTDLSGLKIVGRDGMELRDEWRNGPNAYLGTMVAGFPNLFVMLGPNTGLAHSSMVFIAEAQTRYIMDALDTMRRHHVRQLEVRAQSQARYNDWIQHKLDSTVWSVGGCHSWYLSSDGDNRTLWPGYTFAFWWRTRKLRAADYMMTG